jgi:hypothetical protein
MAKFLLALHETPDAFRHLSPEEIQGVIEKYRSWSAKQREAGRLVGGEKLKDEGGKHVTQQKGKLIVTDGPYSESREVIGGFFMIEAADYVAAVELTRDCPHLEFGRIEIREVEILPSCPDLALGQSASREAQAV